MTACDLSGEIDSLMARLVSCVISFWCDRPVMISDLAACSKELSAGTFNYRGDWFWPRSPPRLVFISNCRLTVKQHYQRCHPKPKLLMYKSNPGPDYHSVSGMWATVALFLLTTPSPLLSSLSFKYLSAHIKNWCQVHTLHALSQTNQSQVRPHERVHIREILQTSACSACPHHLDPCVTVKGCGEEKRGTPAKK